ncbi:MAG: type II toxin-antitoxin system MqsA family antitoxin [Selenomonadaceae bacterium]|nr:type II toxin-antitoxin system MqsA family antitoxin [Selenomonadaceae bacterium]
MCMYCRGKDFVESTTTHVVNLENCLIIIKNVPCMECDQCGETFFNMSVALKLDEIVETAKKMAQELSIIDYKQAA